MQYQAPHDFDDLLAAHAAMMKAYEAAYDRDDDEASDIQERLYAKLLVTRRALLDHRPRTLDEVRRKAELMMGDRAFIFWDIDGDVEEHFPAVIASLIPEAADSEDQRDAA